MTNLKQLCDFGAAVLLAVAVLATFVQYLNNNGKGE